MLFSNMGMLLKSNVRSCVTFFSTQIRSFKTRHITYGNSSDVTFHITAKTRTWLSMTSLLMFLSTITKITRTFRARGLLSQRLYLCVIKHYIHNEGLMTLMIHIYIKQVSHVVRAQVTPAHCSVSPRLTDNNATLA